jgi:hypothetical protein
MYENLNTLVVINFVLVELGLRLGQDLNEAVEVKKNIFAKYNNYLNREIAHHILKIGCVVAKSVVLIRLDII